MKFPNGYGSVYKLSGNRRKPWIARKTIGWDDDGKRQYLTIGYYEKREKALQALAEYNDNPYDLEMSRITFSNIYDRWFKDEFNEYSNATTVRGYVTAYKRCEPLYNMRMSDIRSHHMQKVLDSCQDASYETVKKIHTLLNKLYKWCIAHDCVKKNYAEGLKINIKFNSKPKKSFTDDEINLLWKNVYNNEYIPIVLILIYSGVRISELLNLKKEDVYLDKQYFEVKESKTTAGIRIVPIADKVLPFWKDFLEKSPCQYAFVNSSGNHMTYDNFKKRYWYPIMEQLQLEHTVHETRHTCISQLIMKNANQTIVKKIVGHKSVMNLTEKVYTHIEIQELISTINLI
ncbi:MAG: tyrosine-type recombinase/integrase [Acutalibacteraceae bacterium]